MHMTYCPLCMLAALRLNMVNKRSLFSSSYRHGDSLSQFSHGERRRNLLAISLVVNETPTVAELAAGSPSTMNHAYRQDALTPI